MRKSQHVDSSFSRCVKRMYSSLFYGSKLLEVYNFYLVNRKTVRFFFFCKEKLACVILSVSDFSPVLRIVGKVDNANVSKTYMVGCNINNFKMQIALDKLFLYSVNLRVIYIVYFCINALVKSLGSTIF